MMPLAAFPTAASRMPTVRRFVSHSQACAVLVAQVVHDLERALAARGAASLAVPGGATPDEFLALLGYRDLAWHDIHVTLTDERWVPPTHERSNAALVARTLGRHGRPYRWFPLWRTGCPADVAVDPLERDAAEVPWPLDVVVLGMGDDGHVASLFPGRESGFEAAGERCFVAVQGPDDEWRVSLTAHAIARARTAYLLIRGRGKESVLRSALGSDLPVARVIDARHGALTVYASV